MAERRVGLVVLILALVFVFGVLLATALTAPAWEQANSSGFGDAQVPEVSAVEMFDGYLYAGTHDPIDPGPQLEGAQILRSTNGKDWSAVTDRGFGSDHDTAPPAILDFTVFKGYLYASTGRGNAAQIWRSQDGVNWGQVIAAGFGDPDIVDLTALAVYDYGSGAGLYVGATKQDSGAQIWRTFVGDGILSNWTQVAPTVPMTDTASVSGMAVFADGSGTGLYAAVAYAADIPAQIWRSYGGAWSTVVNDGFGDSSTTKTGGIAVFGGDLYVGAGNTGSGAQLWRSSDGTTWVEVTPAFGGTTPDKVEMVYVFQNQLYLGVTLGTGIAIWRSSDGSIWEQVNVDGFGDSNNLSTNSSNATADFLDQLYVGTVNDVDGGELWRMQRAYEVNLSPDEGKSGLAGENVTYNLTITNTGYLTDSYDLAASGQTWTTNLSTALVSQLAPSASTTFSATVAIPPGAAFHDTDMVTITATSQGDSSKSDAAVLTTNTAVMVCGITANTPYSLGDIDLTVTTVGSDLDCVRVTKYSNSHPNATTSLQSGQYWTIDGLQSAQGPAATIDYVFNLTLPHNVDPYQEAYVCKYLGGSGAIAWDCAQSGSEVGIVWRDGIASGFSDWAVSTGIPTAVTLSSFEASSPSRESDMATLVVVIGAAATLVWGFWTKRREI